MTDEKIDKCVGLECDHCGCEAICNEDGMYYDGEGGACASCGYPGIVSVGEVDDDDVAFASWSCSDYVEEGEQIPVCNDMSCEECAKWRGKTKKKGDGYCE